MGAFAAQNGRLAMFFGHVCGAKRVYLRRKRITGVFVALNRHVCGHFCGQIAGRNTGRKRVNCWQKLGKMRAENGRFAMRLRRICGAKRANFGRISTIKLVYSGSICNV